MVENVPELLDVPGEWWYDHENAKLYLYPNATFDALQKSRLVASHLATLIQIEGAKDVRIQGLTLSHAKPTFMAEWEVPSAGDWSIHRGGAILVTKSEQILISSNLFDQCGGNAVCVSGRNIYDPALTPR